MALSHFTPSQIKQLASKDEYAAGTYRVKVVAVDRTKTDGGRPEGLSLRVAALVDPEDIESAARMQMFVNCDLGPTELSGEVPKFGLENSAAYAAALNEELPEWPTYIKAEKLYYVAGEVVGGKALTEAKEAALDANLNWLIDIHNDETNEMLNALMGKVFYVDVVHRPGKEGTEHAGRVFVNPANPRRQLRDGETLTAKEDFVAKVAVPETEAAPEPAKKAAPAKAQAKKTGRR